MAHDQQKDRFVALQTPLVPMEMVFPKTGLAVFPNKSSYN